MLANPAPLVAELRELLLPLADPVQAPIMGKYMKEVAVYLGISMPTRRKASLPWLKAQAGLGSDDLLALSTELMAQAEREFAYTAVDLLKRYSPRLAPTALHPVRELALTVPWWDTVDAYAGLLGTVGLRIPEWDAEIATWAGDAQLWARRLALVFQVGRRAHTNLELLWAVCDANLGERDFFMRKGIGWALRDAARTYPDEVRQYVATHRDALSPLSVREATKHL